MLTNKRFHQGGGSSKEHSSSTAFKTGVYGGIDPMTAADIGAASLPSVFRNFILGSTSSAVNVEVVSFTAPTGLSLVPLFVTSRISVGAGATGQGFIRLTFTDASTLDLATGSVTTDSIYFASWGFSTFAADGDAWNAVALVSGDNLFTRLDDTHTGKKLNKIAIFGSLVAGAGPVNFNVSVGGYFI